MKRSKQMKGAAMHSLIALLLCVSMFIGTTFAWFTDSVTSGSNRIIAGNLDVDVQWAESYDGPWYQLDEPGHDVVFDYDLWEPGYTLVRYIRVMNKGSLALKYKLNIEPAGVVGPIADVLDVTYLGGVTAAQAASMASRENYDAMASVGVLSSVITGLHTTTPVEGVILPAGQTDDDDTDNVYAGETVCMIGLHMQETAGNEYQNASFGEGFYITAVATQYQYEEDSFGNDYDEDVGFPELPLPQLASSAVALDESGATTEAVALDSGLGVTATVPAGTVFESGVTDAVLSVALVSQNGNISGGDSTITRTLDVHVGGVAASNTTPIRITIENALPVNMEPGPSPCTITRAAHRTS